MTHKKWEDLMEWADNQRLINSASEAITKFTTGKAINMVSFKKGALVIELRKKRFSKEQEVINKLDGEPDQFEWAVVDKKEDVG